MTVRFTATARREIRAILDYLKARNPQAADNIARAIDEAIDQAELFPASGRIIHRNRIRQLLVGNYRYRLLYVDLGMAGVEIRNVRSTWRQLPWETR